MWLEQTEPEGDGWEAFWQVEGNRADILEALERSLDLTELKQEAVGAQEPRADAI